MYEKNNIRVYINIEELVFSFRIYVDNVFDNGQLKIIQKYTESIVNDPKIT